jgi:hypothetical protein
VACTQAWISYNSLYHCFMLHWVVACTQAWISYNKQAYADYPPELWLALRHGSVTITCPHVTRVCCCGLHSGMDQLQLKARKSFVFKDLRAKFPKIIRVVEELEGPVFAFFPKKFACDRTAYQ